MQLDKLPKRNGFIFSKVLLCFFSCLFVFYSYSVQATISTIASEQSGTTVSIINHVGAGTFASRNSCGNIAPSTPAGSNDDLLIAVALVRETNATVTASAGWTQYYTENHGVGGNQDLEAYIFYRIADGTANDNVTLTSAGTGNCRSLIGQVSRFDGVDTSSPFETDPIVAGNSSTQNTANVTTGTETTTSATAMSIAVTFINDNAAVTEADGFSESFESTSTTGRDSAISLNYRQESSAGAKGAFTWAQNLGTDESIGVLFALTPDGTNEGISINVPTGTTTDDVMLAAISVRPSSTTITAPAGWTLINRVDQAAGASNSQAVYQRVATASEPAAYTWAFSGGAITGTAGGIITYRGVDTVTPIDAFGGNTTVSGTSHTANSINTTVVNTMIVSTHSFSSSETWTPPVTPAGMTEQVDVASLATPNALGISLEMNDVLQAAIGATGNITATAAGNADTGVAQIIALTPLVVNENITVTFTGGPVDDVVAGSISITDAALGTPELSATSTNGVGQADITTSIGPTLTTNALLIDIVGKPRGDGTYTPGAGQTEQFDIERQGNNNGLTGAMSTKQASLATESMVQTHSSATRQNAHAVVSVAPATSTASYDADASRTAGNTSSFSWSHSFTTTNFVNTKLVVGLTYRDAAACGTVSVSTLTIGGLPFNQITSISVTDTDSGDCIYADLWYADLNNIILSTQNNASLGGQAIDQDEAVEYEGFSDTGSLFIDDAIFSANERINALHYLDNGNVALSITGNDGATIGGTFFEEDDIVEVTIDGTFVQELFSEDNFTSVEDNARDVDAVYIRDNGDIVFSIVGTETIQQCGQPVPTDLTITDDDIVEWDVSASCGTIVVSFAPLLSGGGDEDIDGLHYLNDDPMMLLISITGNQNLDGQAFTDGDVILYDRNTSTAYLYMDEGNFTADEEIDALTLTINPVTTATIDHYAISYAATPGVTCEATSVTITARDSSDMPVDVPGGTVLTITSVEDGTATNEGSWGDKTTGSGTVLGFPGNPVTYTWPVSGESSFTIALTQTTPLTIDIDLLDTNGDMEKGDGDNSDPADDPIEFRDVVFRVVDNSIPPVPVLITSKLSGKASDDAGSPLPQDIFLQAIEAVSATECQGVFENQTNVIVELASECNNPTSCETIQVQVDDDSGTPVSIPSNANGSVTSYSPTAGVGSVQLDFDADSKTPLNFVYNDAGQITLHARYDIDSPNMVYISGSSNAFTVRPAGLCVESGDMNSDCVSADGSCSIFRKAGSVTVENQFNLTVRGVTWESDMETNTDFCTGTNVTTPNFELNSIALSHTKIAPVGLGTSNGNLGITSIDIVDADNGTGTESTQTISEVGVFTITATPPAYIGETIAASTSANIGRFYPDRFNVTMQNAPAFTDSCSGFTYIDQPFYYGTAPILEIEALNSNGTTTDNYGGSFWKLTGSALPRTYVDGSATAPTASFSSMTPGSVTLAGESDFDGIGTLALNAGVMADKFMYQKGVPEVEFTADVDVTFQAVGFQDTDHTAMNPICYDAMNDGTCDDFTHSMIQGTDLRWGRMTLDNGFGSELLPIEVPLRTEYFTANGFVINTDDTCTTYDSSDMSFVMGSEDGVVLGDLALTGSGIMVSGRDDPLNSILATSTNNDTGSADVTIDLTSQDWLQFDWADLDMMADGPYDGDPTSRITWGIFSGPDEFIYIREPW